MTLNLEIQYALTALISCSMLGLSLVAPAIAEEDPEKVKIVINVLGSAKADVQARMLELQEDGIEIPLVAKAYHAQALGEYNDAQQALKFGDADLTKIRAMKAMELFKKATDQLGSLEQSQDETAVVIEVDESIAILHHKAEYLKTLAKSNHESINYSDYNSVVNLAKHALKDGSIEEAQALLARADSILADIKNHIQEAADSKMEERVKKFTERMVTRLSEMVKEAEEDDQPADSTLLQDLNRIIEQLKNATDINEIIDMTDGSSEVQTAIKEHKIRSDSNTGERDEKESGSVSEDGKDNSDGKDNEDDNRDKDNAGSGNSGSGSGNSGSGSSKSGNDDDGDDD